MFVFKGDCCSWAEFEPLRRRRSATGAPVAFQARFLMASRHVGAVAAAAGHLSSMAKYHHAVPLESCQPLT